MAEADAAHLWDGQDARERHEHGRTASLEPDRHDGLDPDGYSDRPDHREYPGNSDYPDHSGPDLPGGDGEHMLQQRLGTAQRAERFYDEQVLDHLNERMREFVQRQEMFFLATADRRGECDSSFRAGPRGFLQVLDERTLAYPEYRGNGVHASLGNIQENPHLGIMLIDFVRARIGLHLNGRATIVEDDEIRESHPHLPEDPVPGRRAQLWVRIELEEAYIHCAKHIPQLQKAPKRTARDWGTDDYRRKGGDFFGTARDARGRVTAPVAAAPVAVADEPAEREYEQVVPTAASEPAPQSEEPAEVPSPAPAFVADEYGISTVGAHMQLPAYAEQPGYAWPEREPLQLPEPFPVSSAPSGPAPSGPSAASVMSPGDADSDGWRQAAEYALAEALRRGARSEPGPFQGWFG